MAPKIKSVECAVKIPNCKPVGMQNGRALFLLCNDFIFFINDIRHVVPKGFVFDGASIPYGFRNLFNPADTRYMAYALIHDYFYAGEIYSKPVNDRVFLVGMQQSGDVPGWNSNLMYSAVVGGGWFTYIRRKIAEIIDTRKLLGITSIVRPLKAQLTPLGYMPGMHPYENRDIATEAEPICEDDSITDSVC